jgi:hypothetical protein
MNVWRALDWRRVVVYSHRWLGIAGSLLFIACFVSGVVMMYARMPDVGPDEFKGRMPQLDLTGARVTLSEAARFAGVSPQRALVGMHGAHPVYRLFSQGRWTTVFADDGRVMSGLSAAETLAEAKRLMPEHASHVRYDALLEDADQWTLGSRSFLPLHRIALRDAADTYLYLSDRTGAVVMKTTATGRRWGYAGAVIHWIYFTPFRRNGPLWAQSIIWLSVAGTVACALGILWGVWRYSPRRRYRLKQAPSQSPYAGWMRWHHYAGLLFGLTTMTWVFSGLLSMDPWDWHPGTAPSRAQRDTVAGGPFVVEGISLDDLRSALQAAPTREAAEAEVLFFLSRPFLAVQDVLIGLRGDDRTPRPEVNRQELVAAAIMAMPGIPVEDISWLDAYDAYYYDRSGGLRLPVLRVRYGDPRRTWLYLDPRRGAIVRKEERLTRLNRWLYHGFHSFDFPFLYYRRPLWDAVVIALSLGGIASAVTSLQPAWRRMRRHVRRLIS